MPHALIHLVDITALVMMVSMAMVSIVPTWTSAFLIHAIPMPHATIHMVGIFARAIMVTSAMVSTVQVRRMNLGPTSFIEKLLGILHYFVNYSFSLAEENGNDEEENILKRRRLLDKNAPSMALQDQFSLLF